MSDKNTYTFSRYVGRYLIGSMVNANHLSSPFFSHLKPWYDLWGVFGSPRSRKGWSVWSSVFFFTSKPSLDCRHSTKNYLWAFWSIQLPGCSWALELPNGKDHESVTERTFASGTTTLRSCSSRELEGSSVSMGIVERWWVNAETWDWSTSSRWKTSHRPFSSSRAWHSSFSNFWSYS